MRSQFIELFRFYSRNHKTVGCRVTHMVGVPFILSGLIMLARGKGRGLSLAAMGYGLLMAGHYIFEKNTPVLIRTRDPRIIPTAFAFVGYEWWAVLTKRFPNEPSDPFAIENRPHPLETIESDAEVDASAETVRLEETQRERASNGRNKH